MQLCNDFSGCVFPETEIIDFDMIFGLTVQCQMGFTVISAFYTLTRVF